MLVGKKRDVFDSELESKYNKIDSINGINFYLDYDLDGNVTVITADQKFDYDDISEIDCKALYDAYYSTLMGAYTDGELNIESKLLYIHFKKQIYKLDKIANTYDCDNFTVYKALRKSSNNKIEEIYITNSSAVPIKGIDTGQVFKYSTPLRNSTKGVVGHGIVIIENILKISPMTIEPKIAEKLDKRLPVWELESIQ